jgi:hypothetical protein
MSQWRATEESGLRENCTGRLNKRTEEGPHGSTSSDSTPTKPPNNDSGQPLAAAPQPAEAVEGRRLAKGNPHQQTMLRTQCRVGMPHELERIRQAASRNRKIYHPYPQERFGVTTRGRSPVR